MMRSPRRAADAPDTRHAFDARIELHRRPSRRLIGKGETAADRIEEVYLPHLLREVHQAFHHRLQQQMRAEGIPVLLPSIAPLILHLSEADGLTMSELSERCHLDNSTLTPLVDVLERNGIAYRQRDPDDRRRVLLHLMEAGKELEPRLRRILLQLQESAIQDIPMQSIDIALRVMRQMAANMDGS